MDSFPQVWGRDRIFRRGTQLIIVAAVDMPEWEVRSHRWIAVATASAVWRITGKESLGPRGVRYTLEPWPEYQTQIPGRTIVYDAEYVRRRDEELQALHSARWWSDVLVLFKPLIGFLPSELKLKLEEGYDIQARSATFHSLILQLLTFFGLGAVVEILAFSGMYGLVYGTVVGPRVLLLGIPILLLLLGDLIMRYNSYLSEKRSPYGFGEWLIAPLRDRRARGSSITGAHKVHDYQDQSGPKTGPFHR